jgi:hypothetical protein
MGRAHRSVERVAEHSSAHCATHGLWFSCMSQAVGINDTAAAVCSHSNSEAHLPICCTGDNPAASRVWQHAGLEHIVAVAAAEAQPAGACVFEKGVVKVSISSCQLVCLSVGSRL